MLPLENALRIEIEKLKKQTELMRQLSTVSGFSFYYFTECKKHATNKEAFNHVNDLYQELFGEFRYSDFHSFKRVLIYNNKKKS